MKIQITISALIIAAFFATANAQEKPTEPGNPAGMMSMMKDCPMGVGAVEIAVADTTDGVALTITTTTGNVNELRDRVKQMLAMHDIPAKLETIDNGARVNLTPKAPTGQAALRKQAREHVARMTKGGECEKMHQMMEGMKNGMMGTKTVPEPTPEVKKGEPETDHNAHHPEEKR